MIREKEIVSSVSKALNVQERLVKRVLSEVKEEIIKGLESDEKVRIVGLGTFRVSVSKKRMVLDLRSKQRISVNPKNLVKFYPSIVLKRKFGLLKPFKRPNT